MGEVNVILLAQPVRILAQSDCGRISRDWAKGSKRDGKRPGKTVDGFRVSELGIIGDDHPIALQRGVVVDVEIARKWSVRTKVGGGSAKCGLEMPAALIKFLEGDGVMRL